MSKQSLKTDQFNWKQLLNHPSEFIRIDDKLRLKQLELSDFNEKTPGYNISAAQTHLEHQRLIFNMRCYLIIAATNFFSFPIISANDFRELKRSFIDKENFVFECGNFVDFSNTDDRFWLLMQITSDKNNSEKFFKKMLSEIFSFYLIPKEDQEKMIETVIKKCRFNLK